MDTQAESDFTTVYAEHTVDLAYYLGQSIYVAFVMEQDNGDNWYVDLVNMIPTSSPPSCATEPTPAAEGTKMVLIACHYIHFYYFYRST